MNTYALVEQWRTLEWGWGWLGMGVVAHPCVESKGRRETVTLRIFLNADLSAQGEENANRVKGEKWIAVHLSWVGTLSEKNHYTYLLCAFLFIYLLIYCVSVCMCGMILFYYSHSLFQGIHVKGVKEHLWGVCSLLPPCYGFWGLDSGCQACVSSTFICWAISLAPTGPTLLSGKLYYPQHLEHCLPLSSVQEILVKQGVVVQTSNPSTGELEAGGSGV